MSAKQNGATAPTDASASAPRKLKILMLHGYTQNGPLFHAKTRALEKALNKSFPATKASPLFSTYPGGIQLLYPTAPIKLRPADIPGFDLSTIEGDSSPESDSWGWWIRETGSGLYSGFDEGLETIREAIESVGGIDGVIGFSQGAGAAAFVASLLEDGREEVFASLHSKDSSSYPYPSGWKEMKAKLPQPPLKFAVSYCGFYAPHPAYKAFYEPEIKTPLLNVIGTLDSVVEENRSQGLVDRCSEETRKVVYHPGGHFVPVGKDMAGVLLGFVKECCEVKKREESLDDLDIPF
ncbi:related to dihydrofolate reductase [Phialocephala subalpina]|uniref:Related to dihydrofolate reductase n=1 Tax=Phialocephala subalpina TaxID=576137 RepID=A0A1L7X0E5_9HELO|nr:related to dihydrofolate reductase [Phialocephala subalpina]